MEHIKAYRNGTTARFPLSVWKSGIPAKAGWQLLSEEKAEVVIPKEIVDMSVAQKQEITGVVEKKKAAEPAVKKESKPRKPRASKK